MNAGLNPITIDRLLHFGKRQAWLRFLRGAATALFLVAMVESTAIAIDAFWLLVAWQRWLLSLCVYGIVGAIVWVLCRPALAAPSSLDDVAKSFEFAEPRLREQLLAAVELATDNQTCMTSSIAFRAQLQEQVARSIAASDVALLLPCQLIRTWLVMAATTLVVVVALSCVPGLRLPQRIARTLLPAANLARHTRISLEVVQPLPQSQTVALGDMVPLVVQQFGPKPSSIHLELRCQNQPLRSQALQPVALSLNVSNEKLESPRIASHQQNSARTFQTNIAIDATWIEYRVIADDASTAWYRLDAQPRPQAIQFTKRYVYPEYMEREVDQLIESHGNLEAYAGTTVTMTIQCDQPLAAAQWRSQSDSVASAHDTTSHKIDIQRDTATVELTLTSECSYRLNLKASKTGFTNTFSPLYTVRILPDHPPKIRWTTPDRSSLIVQADSMLNFAAKIEDEMPLAQVRQQIRINASEWIDRELSVPIQATSELKWKFDLAPLRLKPGDMVQTRLFAKDRKQQLAETELIELVVSNSDLVTRPHENLIPRRVVAEHLRQLAESSDQFVIAIKDRRAKEQQGSSTGIVSKRFLQEAEQAALELSEAAKLVRELILGAISKLNDPISLNELERVAHVLAELEMEQLAELQRKCQGNWHAPGSPVTQETQSVQLEIVAAFEHVRQRTAQLDQRFRQFHTHDILAAIGRDFALLITGQRSLASRLKELNEEQVRREQSVLGRHFRELQRLMIEQLPMLDGNSARQLDQWSLWFANHAEYIEQGTIESSSKERVDRLASTVLQQLLLRPRVNTIDVQLPAQLAIGHKEIADLAGMLFTEMTLDKPRLQQIAARRAIHQQRVDADRVFASDLGNTHRALKELLSSASGSPETAESKVPQIIQALGQLESIHDVTEASRVLVSLVSAERWETGSIDAVQENPRLWDGFTHGLAQAKKTLEKAGIPAPIITELAALNSHPAFESAGTAITSRRWSSEPVRSAASDLLQIQSILAQILRKLESIAQRAREVITSSAPSLANLARRAANETGQLHEQTTELAEGLAKQEVPNSRQRVEQLHELHRSTHDPIAELRDALLDLAAAQDLLNRDQMELAQDADTAASIVSEAEQRINDAMQAAMDESVTANEQIERLTSAARQQQDAIDALEMIAKHFASAASGKSRSDSSDTDQAAWRELAEQLGASDPMSQEYAQAEKLAQQAASQPKTLLEQLEQEARRNLPMREELSKIARAAAEESLRILVHAAVQERELSLGLESSDPQFQGAKDLLQQALASATERASSTMGTLIAEASSAATHAQDAEIQLMFDDIGRRLKLVIEQSSAIKSQNSFEELKAASAVFSGVLQDVQQELETVAGDLRAVSQKPVFASEQELRNRRREIEERQRRVRILESRDAQQAVRAEEQRFNHLEVAVRSLTQQRARANQQLSELKKRGQSADKTEQLAKEIAGSENLLQRLDEQMSVLSKNQSDLRQQVEVAIAAKRDQDAARDETAFDAPNPTAQLASQLTERAADSIKKISTALRQRATTNRTPESLQASAGRLEPAVQQQQSVRQSVIEAGQNLARAARHEQRVQHATRQTQLARQSQQVESTANTELRQATDDLRFARDQAQTNAQDAFSRAPSAATRASRHALQRAEDALRERVEELKSLLATDSNHSGREQSGAEQPGNDQSADANANTPMDASRMARMLDELDRQLNEASAQPPNDQSGPTNSTQNSPPSSLTQAAQQLAAQMNQQRISKNSQSTENGPETSMSRASSNPAPASQVQLLNVSRLEKSDWGKLRQQTTEDVVESVRETVAPRYRKQVETYFRVLAEQAVGAEANSKGSRP